MNIFYIFDCINLKTDKNIYKTIILLVLIFVSSCVIPINVAIKKSEKFNKKKIRIQGRVVSAVQLIDIRCFTIKDKTGKILVVTDNLLPLKRDYVKVKGKLNKSYKYKKLQMIAIEEKRMKTKKIKYPSDRKRNKAGKRNIK